MSAAAVTHLDTGLAEVLNQNRATYATLPGAYEKTGPARLLQAKRWLKPFFGSMSEHKVKNVLELGPADGYLTGYLCDLGYDVTAIDFTATMCAATRRHAKKAQVIEAEFLEYQFPSQYDAIVVSAFAHLFPHPWDLRVIKKTHDLLTGNGIAYLATTLHPLFCAGYIEKDATKRLRYRTHHTVASFESLIDVAELSILDAYVTGDRLASEKTWGNWIVGRKS
jgi:SAM-dependent methyltransferase